MGWTFPWASLVGSDFNTDFNVSFTEEQHARNRRIQLPARREVMDVTRVRSLSPQNAAMAGTDVATYTREGRA